jgi:hypothetical protein
MHWLPFWLFTQVPHGAPLLPHRVVAVPVWQVPPAPAEQQPPLHSVLASHAEPHACVVRLHAWLGGQSPALAQPQLMALPEARQAAPVELALQSVQMV